ncbi:MAG TPA: polysaccharide deacetylase family protein [Vicinamibacterales bacterium]|nr:polysaccharide deacetylase family protein [Vicinamibacterales bacterium]
MRPVSLLFHDVYESSPSESGFRSPAADRYKLSLPEFEAQLDRLARLRSPKPSLSGNETRIPAVVTVDDGGISFYTVIADRLEALGLHAQCFVSTDCIGERGFLTPEQIRELDARGHTIGTHSASHPTRFSALTTSDMRREWSDSRQRLEDIVDHPITVGSVPGGYFSRAVAEAAAYAGLQTLYTSQPTSRPSMFDGLRVIGRFTIRRGHAADMAFRFASAAPWARCGAWLGWNAKALVKPVLGASYSRVADWILEPRQ